MHEGFVTLSWVFLFSFSINGLVTAGILLMKNKTFRLANAMLAVNLVAICCISIMITLMESRLILAIPRFYRLPSPLYYAMFPAAYLYVKLLLEDRTRLKPSEYWHFLPAVLHLVEMLPFYLMSNHDKLSFLNQVYAHKMTFYSHQEGWLPAYLHNIIRGSMALVYCYLMWTMLKKARRSQLENSIYATGILNWLNTFTVINAVIGASTVFFLAAFAIPENFRWTILHVIYLGVMLTTNLFLLFRPYILYGLPQPVVMVTGSLPAVTPPHEIGFPAPIPASNELPLQTEETTPAHTETVVAVRPEIPPFVLAYKDLIQKHLEDTKGFLNPDYNLSDLSRETNIPKHHLQLLIFKIEGKRFNEYLLDFRIHHIKELINAHALKNRTLEAVAIESGFSSKSSFIRSIKKATGKTPKEYFATTE